MNRLTRGLKRLREVPTLLAFAALLTLLGLALMVWSLIEPTPMPVILAMSLGQTFGIVAFAMFGLAVLLDQMRKQRVKALAATAAAGATATAHATDPAPAAEPAIGAAGHGPPREAPP